MKGKFTMGKLRSSLFKQPVAVSVVSFYFKLNGIDAISIVIKVK
jgi:hypothetical protein